MEDQDKLPSKDDKSFDGPRVLYGEEEESVEMEEAIKEEEEIEKDVNETIEWDARGKGGFTTIQKYTAALRQLGYGIAIDASDEYLKMFERTGRDCTYIFYEYVIELYRDIYLQHPTKSDVEQLYVAHQAKHGFAGMLGSIDYTHWEWANCPNAWRGQFTRGDHGVPTIILEAVVSHDL
ncbi:uncharacterized protein LOC128134084 [Lactuca sativa]|uniref:uncharacterized protein LOC128134084 n=1 Tax=Lactuca sativa TaxID=4236 RepID=UPI0022AEA06E|nr:uncharacterized protein LOC128134084 [Lactuca sativa]